MGESVERADNYCYELTVCRHCDRGSRSDVSDGPNRDLPNLEPWYAALSTPAFTPPNWIFAPVWTSLYSLLAFAFWRILRTQGASRRIIVFALLLISNALGHGCSSGPRAQSSGSLISGPSLQSLVRRLLHFGFWIGGFPFACPARNLGCFCGRALSSEGVPRTVGQCNAPWGALLCCKRLPK